MQYTKVLIVEDELLIAENLAIKLKKLQYQVVGIVSNGRDAIQKVKKHSPDLILMDIAIKGDLDGIQTAQSIINERDIPIIFLTAYADDKTIERASVTGCYGYLIKPFQDKELHATMKIALTKHQEQTYMQTSLTEITELLGEYSVEKNNAYEDGITKLPNQLMLGELFSYLLTEIEKTPDSQGIAKSDLAEDRLRLNKKLIAVAYIRLYKFERIVTSLDNENNNLLIKLIAERLDNSVKDFKYQGVTLKIASYDFAILLTGLEHRQIASEFFESVLNELRQPFIINDKPIFVTASIGISFYPFDNLAIERLIEQAKQAMLYLEKQNGNKCQFYTSAFRIMNSNAASNLSLEADLHQAIERNELKLYYQPKIDLKTGKLSGAEALLRWHHPKLGIVLPQKILPLAEASGLIDQIDEWVLRQACNQIEIWHQNKLDFLKVAVNLSGNQFQKSDLFHNLTQLLFGSNINPQFLELELTEQVLLDNIQSNIQKLNTIKNLGIQIALDDFGTGYSSLSYLHQFPFNVIKIDRCFIHNIDCNSKNAVITKSIIEMAHNLELQVVAEGIETHTELDCLVKNKCDTAQGYLFAYPLPVREFEKLVQSNKIFNISKIQSTE